MVAVRYEVGLVAFAQALLRGEGDLEAAIAALARAAGVDTLYVERNYMDSVLGPSSEIVGRYDPGVQAGTNIWDAYPWSELPAVHDCLARGEPWILEDSLDLPPGPEKDHYDGLEPRVRSELAIPVMVEGRFAGSMAFVSLSEPRRWEDHEVALLDTAAETLAMVWTRDIQDRRLRELSDRRAAALRIQTALLECSQALLRGADEHAIQRSLEAMRRATDTAAVYIDVNVYDPVLGCCFETRYLATRPGLTVGAGSFFERAEWSSIPATRDALMARTVWMADLAHPLPPSHASFMADFQHVIQAEMVAPVFVGAEWVAAAGLVDDKPRVWTADERRMLEAVSDMFGSYWRMERSEAELADLLQAKDKFVASISHELRTPLAAVVGYTAELRDRAASFGIDEQAAMIEVIAEQATEVNHIVDDLLVAARAETAQIAVRSDRVDLSACIESALNSVPKEIQAAVAIGNIEPISVTGDAIRLRQIVRNLLTNAFRHGGEDIRVDARVEAGVGVVRISDTGPAIPEDERESMFEAYRSVGSSTGPLPSIGLGLTVSRHLARLMDGDLAYSFDGESAFVLSLPLAV